MSHRPIRVTDATFEREVVRSTLPVVVDFYAEWCAPYREIAPLLWELAEKHAGQVRFVDVNIDEAARATRSYGIHTLPTFLFVRKGQEKARAVGAIDATALRAMVARHAGAARSKSSGGRPASR